MVANRLPVDRFENPDGSVEWRTSPGGLVTAFEPVMRTHRGAWVGWPGSPDDDIEPFTHNDLQLEPVHLSAEDVELYYEGFSNGTLWPLYHDVVAPPAYHREWWDRYVTVNERFAEAAARVAEEGGQVWIQDYQLQLVPQMLRQLRPDLRIGFFLHIPFPPTELFQQLPWRSQILQGSARRRPGRLPAARRRPELRPAGAAALLLRDPAGSDPDPRRSHGHRPGVPDRDRLPEHARAGHGRLDGRAGPRDPGRSR